MRKTLLLLFTLAGLTATADPGQTFQTTDQLTIGELTVVPGNASSYKMTVALEGSRQYSAYNMDIVLPDGLDVEYRNDAPRVTPFRSTGTIYPYTIDYDDDENEVKVWAHQLNAEYGTAGPRTLRIACVSMSSQSFTGNSGTLLTVFVKATPYLKPGTATIKITGIALATANGDQYLPGDQNRSINVGTSSSLTLNISAENKWSTCVLPFDAALPSGVKAYSCGSVSGDYVVLNETASLAAYTPYVLYAENGYSGPLAGTVDASKYAATPTAGLLNGAIVSQEITTGYVLQNLTDGVKFYNVNGQSFTIPEGRCWLSASSSSRSLGFNEETTALRDAKRDLNAADVYDLQGRRVAHPQSGRIYIIGGQKFLKIR